MFFSVRHFMVALPPYTFSLLNVALLVGMTVFILVRRPRQALTWAFAAVMMGLAIFFLADVAQHQPAISTRAVSRWQFILNQGSALAIYSALVLLFLLRDRQLAKWEVVVACLIVARMIIDAIWLAGRYLPEAPYGCLGPAGFGRFPCLYDEPVAIATAVIAELALAVLFISTTFKAAEPKRSILRRYLLWIVLLVVASSVIWQALELNGRAKPGVLPIAPATLIAFVLVLRLFLALEEADTGVQIPAVGWRVFLWGALLLTAVLVDVMWGVPNAPVWTLLVVVAGTTAGAAMLVNSLTRHNALAPAKLDPSPPAPCHVVPPSPSLDEPLRVYLFGPMRVVRDNETLPNTSEIWRSSKTRSLLAYLALKCDQCATQIELVDALWPNNGDWNGASDARNRKNLHSYLSTLRRVLEPDGARGSETFVTRDSERLYLCRTPDLWVDVWEFERLVETATAHQSAGRTEDLTAALDRLTALYDPEGLLPDEQYLPLEFVEPYREHYRRRWQWALRLLKAHHAALGTEERAVHTATSMRQAAS